MFTSVAVVKLTDQMKNMIRKFVNLGVNNLVLQSEGTVVFNIW